MNGFKLDEKKKINLEGCNIDENTCYSKELSRKLKECYSGRKFIVKRGKVYQLKKGLK